MSDKNYIQEENTNWLKCENCKWWYNSKCALLSNEEYEEIAKNNVEWFCHDANCQEKKNKSTKEQNNRRNRSHLSRVLRRIPKGARYLAATKLSKAVENCIAKNDEESWQHLMLFAYKGVMVPEKLDKKQSLNSEIKENLNQLKLPTPKQPQKLSFSYRK